MLFILLMVLMLFFVGALPAWPHSRRWSYYPSGSLGVAIVILLIVMVARWI